MPRRPWVVLGIAGFLAGAMQAPKLRYFPAARLLEDSADNSANVSAGDLDGDGDLDLILAKGRHSPRLDRVLLNDGKAGFTGSDLGPTADRSYSGLLADLDGDGDLDVVVSNDRPDPKLLYLNDGKGRFLPGGTWGAPEWSMRNAAVADLDGDKHPDIIAANRPGPSYTCLNDGKGGFSRPCVPLAIGSATSVVPADFNNDGFVDIAVPYRDRGQSVIFLNDGHGNFPRTIPFGPTDATARVGAAADFNGDGWQDLAVGEEGKAMLIVYLNDRTGRLSPVFQTTTDTSRVPYAIAAGDLNRDGRPDVVIGFLGARPAIFFNQGTGRRFTEVRFGDAEGDTYGFALADFNGDGFPDIAMARSGAHNVLYLSEPRR